VDEEEEIIIQALFVVGGREIVLWGFM